MNDRTNESALIARVSVPSLAMEEEELLSVLESSVYPGAKRETIKLVISYCRASNLDPLQKPVHIVPMKVKTGKKDPKGYDVYEERDTIMPGIGLYRTQASRTSQHAGTSKPVFGPMATLTFERTEWSEGPNGKRVPKHTEATMEFPEWCEITVKRVVMGREREFVSLEYWLENYATIGKSDAPNSMWAKRARGQLAKCAEAQALRKAFPELGNTPTAEEMAGKTIDEAAGLITDQSTGEVILASLVEQPQSIAEVEKAVAANAEQAPVETQKAVEVEQPKAEEKAVKATPAKTGEAKTLTDGQVRVLRAKMMNAALTETDFEKKFKCPIAGAKVDPNTVIAWISNPLE